MAVQARPGPSLVVAQPELLFAILMEAFDRPAEEDEDEDDDPVGRPVSGTLH